MPQEDLDDLSDEDLLTIFRIVEESKILDEGKFNASTTPDQIRDFLLLMPGVDYNEISSMTDEELMKVAEDLLDK